MEDIFPEFIRPYLPIIKNVAIAIGILIGGWIVSRIISKILQRTLGKRNVDRALTRFFSELARYGVLVATVIASLAAVGVQTTSLVAAFASAGLAIGLAMQGSLSHFAAGVMILFFRPFQLDDVVTVAGQTGRVDDIGLFSTTLITANNEKVIVPNSKVTSDCIVNLTALGKRRGAIVVGVAYGTEFQPVQDVLLAAARRVDVVLADPPPAAAMTGLGASSVDYSLLCWANAADFVAMLGKVRRAVYEDLNAAGIEIPFNQIVVHHAPGEEKAAA